MRLLPQSIFSEFQPKILEGTYSPTNPLDTLKARLTAASLLQNPNPDIAKKARVMIHNTSTFKEKDLDRLQKFVEQVKTWDELQIYSTYTNAIGIFLEYKLSFTDIDEHQQNRHFHACYEQKEKSCIFVSQTTPLIRIIGDPILQKPGIQFPQNPTPNELEELNIQIKHATSVLIQTSGAGIAANQCAGIENPYCFTIVGVFDIPEHIDGVAKRYPNTKFPVARIMVNPVITTTSQETQPFNHACLSVPCANRCSVVSPKEISVSYQDPLDEMKVKNAAYVGIDAVVLWHELTHIVDGKTYMDVTFESLSLEDCLQSRNLLHREIQNRTKVNYSKIPELTVPPFHLSVKIDKEGVSRLDSDVLTEVLPKISEETLYGMFTQVTALLKKKGNVGVDLPRVSHLSVLTSEKEKPVDDNGVEFRL